MESQIVLRKAEFSDVEILYKFISDLEEKELDREGFFHAARTNLQQPGNLYLIAEIAGEPVGVGSCHVQWLLHHAAPIAEVQEMYVVPKYRSMGVGARLLHALVDFARSCNAENVELSSQKKRVDAHRFYVREGFQNNHLKFQLRLREA